MGAVREGVWMSEERKLNGADADPGAAPGRPGVCLRRVIRAGPRRGPLAGSGRTAAPSD